MVYMVYLPTSNIRNIQNVGVNLHIYMDLMAYDVRVLGGNFKPRFLT